MQTLVTIVHVMVCLFLMLTVLLQAGSDGGMGAAFGGGSSTGTVFGGSGASSFLRKLTVASAVTFMLTSMTLAWMATPSTDPLKDYWSKQEQAKAAREKAHEQALANAPKTGADKNDKGTSADKNKNTPQNASPVDTGDKGGATSPAPADGSKSPADSSKPVPATKPAGKTNAPTPAASGKPAATTTPAAKSPAGHKAPAKPAAGAQPQAP